MTNWTVLIYAVAAVLAIQRLLAMMTAQRRQVLRQYVNEQLQKQVEPGPAATKSKTMMEIPQKGTKAA